MAALIRTLKYRSERGAELVEAALTLPLILLVMLGIIDFGFLFQQYEVVTNAAREGARVAALPTYSADPVAAARQRVDEYLTAGGLDTALSPDATVTAVCTDLGGGKWMSSYSVLVAYPHTYTFVGSIAGMFGSTLGTVTLHAQSVMRREVAGTCP